MLLRNTTAKMKTKLLKKKAINSYNMLCIYSFIDILQKFLFKRVMDFVDGGLVGGLVGWLS